MAESPDLGGGSSYLQSKHGVALEVLYERYKEHAGIPLRKFLKFLRDAVLLDNSWTFGQAVTVFFEHSNDEERNQEAGERVLTLNDFTMCMKKVARQSLVVRESSRKFKVEDTRESQENEYYLFEGLQRAVSERLQAVPRSDEDTMLNAFILSEQIQLFCLSNEYKMRQIYKRLIKVKSWSEVLTSSQKKLTKLDATKFFRDIIPKDQGTALRQDDLYAIFRNASHEITSKESAPRELSNDFSFPEFVEILVRCALSSSFKLLEEGDEDDNSLNKTRAFTFDAETDSVAYAAERVKAFWRLVWGWLQSELSREDEYRTEDVLMEDCPIYDDASIDMQMLFAHYSTGQAYTHDLDFSNPNTAMTSADLIRLCRDAGLMDHRLTYTSIIEAIVHTKRNKEWLGAELNFTEWQVFFVRLAILKYVELPKMEAVTIMVKKWLLPMVYTDIVPTESSEFLFSPRVLILFVSYETHIAKLLTRYSTERNVTMNGEGKVIEEKDVTGTRKELQKKQSASSFSSDIREELEKIKQPNTYKVKTTFLTLVDLVSFLKTVGFVPRLLAVNEVIDIFGSILNVNPSRQLSPHSAQIFVPHVVETVVQCSLLSFARPPHASKYATREEKILAGMEMVEVTFFNMTGSVIPLKPTPLHPILTEEFKNISQESELREYLLTRRCCIGNALIPVPKLSSSDATTHQGKYAQRLYEPSSESEDGKRPLSIGIPCLVREQHFAPAAPHPIGALMETALIHHNSARYKAAVDTYLQACNTWVNLPPASDAASEEGDGNIQERREEEEEEEGEEDIPQDVEGEM
eukprot:68820-Hanusia_phi.AAC.2